MDNSQEILDRLTPKHIADDFPEKAEDLKKDIDETIAPKPKKKSPSESLKANKEYPFDFSWTSPNGKVWEGQFTNKILSISDRQRKGLAIARFSGGMPLESIDELTYEINIIVAHLMYSLVKFPDWAKDLTSLDEVSLIQAIYKEVLSHENTFFGYGEDQAGS